MATEKSTTEFHGYPSALAAAMGETSRVSALINAIGHLSELLEDSMDHNSTIPLATAIQALVESAHAHNETVAKGLDAIQELEAQHG